MQRTNGARRIAASALGAVCAIATLSMAGTRTAEACPESLSFADLLDEANGIVIARVVSIDEGAPALDDGEPSETIATLEIEQSLKGPFDGSQPLRVAGFARTSGELSTPDRMLVLIGTPEGDGDLVAILRLDASAASDRDTLAARVSEYLDASAIDDARERAIAEREWSVKCVETPALGDIAMDQLARVGYLVEQSGEDYVRTDMIDPSQVERLVAVLQAVETPSDGYLLLEYLRSFEDQRVVAQMRTWLDRADERETDDAGWLMQLTASQLHWTTGEWLASQYYDTESVQKKHALVARFNGMIDSLEELPEALDAYEKARLEEQAALQSDIQNAEQLNDVELVPDTPDEGTVSIDELTAPPAEQYESPEP